MRMYSTHQNADTINVSIEVFTNLRLLLLLHLYSFQFLDVNRSFFPKPLLCRGTRAIDVIIRKHKSVSTQQTETKPKAKTETNHMVVTPE